MPRLCLHSFLVLMSVKSPLKGTHWQRGEQGVEVINPNKD